MVIFYHSAGLPAVFRIRVYPFQEEKLVLLPLQLATPPFQEQLLKPVTPLQFPVAQLNQFLQKQFKICGTPNRTTYPELSSSCQNLYRGCSSIPRENTHPKHTSFCLNIVLSQTSCTDYLALTAIVYKTPLIFYL